MIKPKAENKVKPKPQDNENCLNPNKTLSPSLSRNKRFCQSHIFQKGYDN